MAEAHVRLDEITILSETCGGCGHRLPNFQFYRIAGPWLDPDAMARALEGTLNQLVCPICGFVGYFEKPWLICAPARNRNIVACLGKMIIPLRREAERELWRLLQSRLGEQHEWVSLPT